MASHSGVLAWRIPGTGEPGGLPSMWSHRVGHDWSDLAAAVGALERLPWWLSGQDSARSAGGAGDVVWSLGWEDSLEEGVATHSSILAWEITWTVEPGGLWFIGSQRVNTTEMTEHAHASPSNFLLWVKRGRNWEEKGKGIGAGSVSGNQHPKPLSTLCLILAECWIEKHFHVFFQSFCF